MKQISAAKRKKWHAKNQEEEGERRRRRKRPGQTDTWREEAVTRSSFTYYKNGPWVWTFDLVLDF